MKRKYKGAENMREVIGHTIDENKNFKFVYADDSIYKKAVKEVISLNNKYKLICINLDEGEKTLENLIFKVEYQRDAIEGGDDYNDDLEYLREEGKTEAQIKRIQQASIKVLTNFINKYN
jgi:hypothetical protein